VAHGEHAHGGTWAWHTPARRGSRYRFFADFLAVFFIDFFPFVLVAGIALADFFPKAAVQLSEYFFDAPIRTIVTVS
jgi:hypothetical protein